jgi:hypothetical protein
MKHFYILTFFFLFIFSAVKAAPGDTTMVQAQKLTRLENYGNYDTVATFPASSTKTYRKINMTFTLGKYQCPGSPQYCGDWDYTVMIYLVTPTKTLELGRFMTPYANVSRFGWNWKHRYVFDVTDYAQYLTGNNTIRIMYSGYSGGFTANIKYDFIEGTPPRNVVGIERAWNGYFIYGNPSQSIEALVNNRTFQMPANAQSAELKLFLSGHGSNSADNCAEFCQKYYQVKLNNGHLAQQSIWRDNCGSNNLYPQTGTWLYDRANWCPGDMVAPYKHALTGLTPGSPFNVDVDFEPYSFNGSTAGWQLEGQVIYYGAPTSPTDVSLENIISPSNHEAFFRDNQVCQEPKIEVRNTGSTTLTSLEIEYGMLNGLMHTYQWQGSLAAGEVSTILLPTVAEIQSVTGNNVKFKVKITKSNGVAEQNILNNELSSTFTPLPVWPNNLVLQFTTNRASSRGYNETTWKLYDAAGNIVKQRINNPNQSTLLDTLALQRGCYRLEMEDAGCDGIMWWAYQYYQPNPGYGSLIVREKGKTQQLQMRGYFAGDFGCSFSQTFYVSNALGIQKDKAPFEVSVYPNPATDVLQVNVSGSGYQGAGIKLTNSLGQVIYETKASGTEIKIPVKNIAAGIYSLSYQSGQYTIQKQVVVAH